MTAPFNWRGEQHVRGGIRNKAGNSAAVRASIVVPVIGYLIILNSTFTDYLKLHGIEWVHEPATISDRIWGTKLYLIYFGLMSLGLGAAIYQWKCPHFVKKHPDWTDYGNYGDRNYGDSALNSTIYRLIPRTIECTVTVIDPTPRRARLVSLGAGRRRAWRFGERQ
jgi:hypothetical protein